MKTSTRKLRQHCLKFFRGAVPSTQILFPQAFTHSRLTSVALDLDRALGARDQRCIAPYSAALSGLPQAS